MSVLPDRCPKCGGNTRVKLWKRKSAMAQICPSRTTVMMEHPDDLLSSMLYECPFCTALFRAKIQLVEFEEYPPKQTTKPAGFCNSGMKVPHK